MTGSGVQRSDFAAIAGWIRPDARVLDLGCGMGHWRTALEKLAPKARHRGVEYSDYLCERFGWEKGSAVDFAPGRTFDLVVCQGVLQYLDDRAAARAIDNLADLEKEANPVLYYKTR